MVLKKNGLFQSIANHALFFKHFSDGRIVVLIIYIDDIILTGNHEEEIKNLKGFLALEYEIKDL